MEAIYDVLVYRQGCGCRRTVAVAHDVVAQSYKQARRRGVMALAQGRSRDGLGKRLLSLWYALTFEHRRNETGLDVHAERRMVVPGCRKA